MLTRARNEQGLIHIGFFVFLIVVVLGLLALVMFLISHIGAQASPIIPPQTATAVRDCQVKVESLDSRVKMLELQVELLKRDKQVPTKVTIEPTK